MKPNAVLFTPPRLHGSTFYIPVRVDHGLDVFFGHLVFLRCLAPDTARFVFFWSRGPTCSGAFAVTLFPDGMVAEDRRPEGFPRIIEGRRIRLCGDDIPDPYEKPRRRSGMTIPPPKVRTYRRRKPKKKPSPFHGAALGAKAARVEVKRKQFGVGPSKLLKLQGSRGPRRFSE